MILELCIKSSFLGPNHYIGIMLTHYLTSWRATSDIYVVAVDILMHPGPLLVTERCLILQLPPITPCLILQLPPIPPPVALAAYGAILLRHLPRALALCGL